MLCNPLASSSCPSFCRPRLVLLRRSLMDVYAHFLSLQVKDAGYYMCKDRINDLIIAPVLRAGAMNAILGCQVELPTFVLVCTPVPCEIAQRMPLVVVSQRILLSFCPGPAHPRARRDAALLRGARRRGRHGARGRQGPGGGQRRAAHRRGAHRGPVWDGLGRRGEDAAERQGDPPRVGDAQRGEPRRGDCARDGGPQQEGEGDAPRHAP